MNNMRGMVTISKTALMQLVYYSAKQCGGVFDITDTSRKKKFSAMIFKKDEPDGVYITKTKDGICAEVCVVLKYGADAQSVKTEISEKVKNKTAGAGIKIDSVNVRIEEVKN